MIEIKNLSKAYRTHQVFTDVNLTFEASTVHGIVGRNGAGKTTLFNCITGIESYDGEISFENKEYGRHIGYLSTNPHIMSKITGYEYLRLLCNARKIFDIDFDDKNIFDLPLKEYAQNYSTGMKKKLALLGILLQQNEIYILDEPYNGLDIQSNIMVNHIIEKLKAKSKTVIISSHMMGGLIDISDTMSYIKNKKVFQLEEKTDFRNIEEDMQDDSIMFRLQSFIDNL